MSLRTHLFLLLVASFGIAGFSARLAPAQTPFRAASGVGLVQASRAHLLLRPSHERELLALLRERPPGRSAAVADSLPEGMPLVTRALWGRRGVFRSVGLAPESRAAELRLRRSMLQWHQRLGLLTFGAFTTQLVLGELMAADRAKYYASLRPVHEKLGYTTFGTYLATASLSLAAPPGRRYGDGFSSIRLHRYLAVVHFTGMMLQPWLGAHLSRATSAASYDRRLRTHRWVGRSTYAAFTAALFTIFLPY